MIKFVPANPAHSQQSFRLAHISDPHLSNLDNVSWRQLINKRILGYLSWRVNRRFIHRLDILDSLIRDLDHIKAHHLVISGDLTHIGTAPECEQVRQWLENLGACSDISVIPGNHDSYTHDDLTRTTDRWSAYMVGDAGSDSPATATFPSFRQRGPLAIIGLCTALPTAPFFATGRLGSKQINKLAELLQQSKEQGLFRVVVLHHGPLVDSNKFRKRLIDAEQFRSVIKSNGAELILHGHGHYPVSGWLDTVNVKIPVIGAASASLLSSSATKRAGYNIYEVNATASGWKVQMQSRCYDKDDGVFKNTETSEFTLPASPHFSQGVADIAP